jgi:hypothetical protein
MLPYGEVGGEKGVSGVTSIQLLQHTQPSASQQQTTTPTTTKTTIIIIIFIIIIRSFLDRKK